MYGGQVKWNHRNLPQQKIARSKADILCVANAFAVMGKVNELPALAK
jgi:hypothetical protein